MREKYKFYQGGSGHNQLHVETVADDAELLNHNYNHD